jgi:hypothetical protein
MSNNPNIDFAGVKQDRSKKTLDDLLQAAYELVEATDTSAFTSRSLAKKAGYAKGTLTKRLGPIENVFLWAIAKGREIKSHQSATEITQFDPNITVHDFVETFIDRCFSFINATTSKVIKFYDQRYTRLYGLTTDYFDWINVYVEPYMELCHRNVSGTFRVLSKDEARFMFKAIHALVERPFATDDPIAGTAEHRRIAIVAITKLLAK